ncbi:hypothetical protein ACXR8U_13730 [Methylobacterium radiotolerans]|uniref:hypothetical protein n=1 Tax=Methylobacterium TaxID=407 RepID=UPI0005DCF42D|nr:MULTISPECIES: hypothetical protein [Methylobacterium]MBN6821762.1 hypothetical protein [Methylobacterium organophilum]OXE40252.1 hypothetical protein CCS92_19640 [Methylobacterium radiotolerans]GAN49715.1 hypothetical protein ME121_3746 [Methylobacterium sp. ME121]
MKWVLLWVTLAGNGTVTSGSAEFDTVDACFAAQRAYGGLTFDVGQSRLASPSTESTCVNTGTGEKRSAIKPRS